MRTPSFCLCLLATPMLVAQGTSSTSGSSRGPTTSFQRITDRSADDQFTVRDLLGRKVHDNAGDEVGEIVDVELGGNFPTSVALGLGASESQRDPRSDRRGQVPAGSRSSTPTDEATAPDRAREPAVLISVGGIFGMGADLVRAPASALRYNEEDERLYLDITQRQLQQLTDADAAEGGDAGDRQSAGTATKLALEDPVKARRQLMDAVAADPELAEVADRINLTVNESDVVVFGTVHSAAQRTALIGLIEKHTDAPVRDHLQVDPSVRGDATTPAE